MSTPATDLTYGATSGYSIHAAIKCLGCVWRKGGLYMNNDQVSGGCGTFTTADCQLRRQLPDKLHVF